LSTKSAQSCNCQPRPWLTVRRSIFFSRDLL